MSRNVGHYHFTMCNSSYERRSHVHRGGGQKSCMKFTGCTQTQRMFPEKLRAEMQQQLRRLCFSLKRLVLLKIIQPYERLLRSYNSSSWFPTSVDTLLHAPFKLFCDSTLRGRVGRPAGRSLRQIFVVLLPCL